MAAQTAGANPEAPPRRNRPEQLGSQVPAVRKLLIAVRVRRARSFVRVSGVGRHARSHVRFLRNRRKPNGFKAVQEGEKEPCSGIEPSIGRPTDEAISQSMAAFSTTPAAPIAAPRRPTGGFMGAK